MCWKCKRDKRMSDKKEKTKNEDKEVKPDTILINTMYTGNYTNENIGHEIINLYKADNTKNYIYISPYGKIHNDRYDKLKTILLARPAGRNRLEIIAKANIIKQFNKDIQEDTADLKEFYEQKLYKNKKINELNDKVKTQYFLEQIIEENDIFGLSKEDAEKKLCIEWFIKNRIGLKKISDRFIMSRIIVTQEQMKNIQYEFIWQQLKNNIEITDKKTKVKYLINDKNIRHNKEEVTEKKIEFINSFNNTMTINLNELKNELKNENLKNKFEKLSQYVKIYNELLKGNDIKKETKDDIKKYFEKDTYIAKDWKNRRKLHNHHMKLIKDLKIQYGKVDLDKIIKDNKWDDVNAHFTFEAEVMRPEKSIYIEYTSPGNNKDESEPTQSIQNKNTGSMSSQEEECAKFVDIKKGENSRTYIFEEIKYRNQSCMKYIQDKKHEWINKEEILNNTDYDEFKNKKGGSNIYAVISKIIMDETLWKDEDASTKIVENDDDTNAYEQFFLDITGNQYDELAYSNMFSYFFKKYPEIFVCFANEVLNVKDVNTANTFEVIREENNVDILIETDNDIFVIENKVKSHINGEKYIDDTSQNTNNSEEHNGIDSANKKNDIVETDKKGIEYTNQLIKYYNYVESKYPQYKNKHYYIFKPDYNNTEEELRQKIEKIKNKAEIEPIINEYHHINYSVIFNFYKNKPKEWLCKTLGSDNGKSAGNEDSKKVQYTEQIITDYVYFKDFIRALKRHINPTDNTNELIMKYKFKQAIKKAQNGENPCPNLTEWCDNIKLSAGGSPRP